MTNVVGINEQKIDKLINEIYFYSNRIKMVLDQADSIVENTNSFYDCESAKMFRSAFEKYKRNFNIINKNILSYSDDLSSVKNFYRNKAQMFSVNLKK